MGRPRKRKLQEGDTDRPSESRSVRRETSTPEASLVDSVAHSGNNSINSHLDFSSLDLPDFDIDNLASFPQLDPIPSPTTQGCACLSSMYLTLDNLRSMSDFEFPNSLCYLRDALGTAKTCIECQVCPTRFLTATQNVQILGTLLLSISERYGRILHKIGLDAGQAEELGQLKLLHVGSTATNNAHGITIPTDHLVVELSPSEWRRLARKTVMAELHGTADTSRDSFMSILVMLEQRQDRWHRSEPADDCPSTYRSRRHVQDGDHNPMCLMLAREAKRLITLFDLD